MPDYDAMKELLGKTIVGIVVKENTQGTYPARSVHFVFDDGRSYEIYTLNQMSFAKGLNGFSKEELLKYENPPMKNVFNIWMDKE